MNAVGIDVSKRKSMIAIMRPLGEVVATPFEVGHTAAELNKLAKFILKISGETRVVMEYTGVYFEPIARALYDAGLCVCVVHAQLIHNYGNNTIRKVKTDKADAIKIANYALDNWGKLKPYTPIDEVRRQLKAYFRNILLLWNFAVWAEYLVRKLWLRLEMFCALKRKNLLFALPVLRRRRMNQVNLNLITELFPKKVHRI